MLLQHPIHEGIRLHGFFLVVMWDKSALQKMKDSHSYLKAYFLLDMLGRRGE